MTPLHRILVDWDWEADGIWWIRSAREQNEQKLPPWSYLLSAELVSALKKWNDDGGDLYGPKVIDSAQTDQRQTVFRNAGALLAEWVQRELGEEWEVLYNAGSEGWAWTWVQPPWRRN